MLPFPCKLNLNDMDTYKKPEHMRAPENLSAADIKKSLEELDNKIKTLKARFKGGLFI